MMHATSHNTAVAAIVASRMRHSVKLDVVSVQDLVARNALVRAEDLALGSVRKSRQLLQFANRAFDSFIDAHEHRVAHASWVAIARSEHRVGCSAERVDPMRQGLTAAGGVVVGLVAAV